VKQEEVSANSEEISAQNKEILNSFEIASDKFEEIMMFFDTI